MVKSYEKENKGVLLELFKKYPDKNVIIFHSREEAERWLMQGFS